MDSYKVCQSCGRQNPMDSQWCASCGSNIANVAPQQQWQQPQQSGQYQQQPVYGQPTKFCSSCGNQIDVRAEICPKCGVRQIQNQAPPPLVQPIIVANRKSEGLAAVLSFIIPGLGQIYNGEIGKGIAIIIGSVILWMFFWLLIPLLILLIIYIWSIYDAYKTAQNINQQAMMQGNYQQYPRQY